MLSAAISSTNVIIFLIRRAVSLSRGDYGNKVSRSLPHATFDNVANQHGAPTLCQQEHNDDHAATSDKTKYHLQSS